MFHRVAIVYALIIFGARLAGAELAPAGPGTFPVATTNLEVSPRESGPMLEFLNGKVSSKGIQYLTDILIHPEAVPTVQIEVPSNPKLFGAQAGTRVPLVLLIVYPTANDNPRPAYKFPYTETGDSLFTHMQRPGDQPLFADPGSKYPLIIFSGGYNTHGLWHLFHLKDLAAHGYIVVDMFHGDGRSAGIDSSAAMRAIELRATLDFLLVHSDFSSAIDQDRIGAAGESMGGHTVVTALGGFDPSGRMPAGADPRVKAAVGIVPFLGGSLGFWPFKMDFWFFGADHAGLRQVRRPFLAIYGGKDGNVPPEGVEAGVRAMVGPTTAVMLDGEKHLVSNQANTDIRTWELLFFDAWLRDDTSARQKLKLGTSVRGGVNDHKTFESGADRRAAGVE